MPRDKIPAAPRPPAQMPYELMCALKGHERAAQIYLALAPSHQRAYRDWIAAAKREDTRARRSKEAIKLLLRGARLGLR